MKIDLRKKLNAAKSEEIKLLIKERLPHFVASDVEMSFTYEVAQQGPLYLLNIDEKASISVICQRCMGEFEQPFEHQSQIAICATDKMAQQYQSLYDVIVISDLIVNIEDILVDDLYLYLPNNHKNIDLCNTND